MADVDPTAEVEAYLASVDHPTRRADAQVLDQLFREVTGWQPRLWGGLVGYGRYHYVYKSGREGDSLATGFGPRKANLARHIMPGYADFSDILGRMGKHKTGAACVYINKLADVDLDAVRDLVAAGLDRLKTMYPVEPSGVSS